MGAPIQQTWFFSRFRSILITAKSRRLKYTDNATGSCTSSTRPWPIFTHLKWFCLSLHGLRRQCYKNIYIEMHNGRLYHNNPTVSIQYYNLRDTENIIIFNRGHILIFIYSIYEFHCFDYHSPFFLNSIWNLRSLKVFLLFYDKPHIHFQTGKGQQAEIPLLG